MMIMRNAERMRNGVIPCSQVLKQRAYRWMTYTTCRKTRAVTGSMAPKRLSRDASTCLRLTNEGRFWASIFCSLLMN